MPALAPLPEGLAAFSAPSVFSPAELRLHDAHPANDLRLIPREVASTHAVVECANGQLDWDIVLRTDKIGLIRLDFLPHDFNADLARHCPALRICLAPNYRGRGLATASLSLFIALLQGNGFHRPLLAACPDSDAAAETMLLNVGFMPTGCVSHGAGGILYRHMILLIDET